MSVQLFLLFFLIGKDQAAGALHDLASTDGNVKLAFFFNFSHDYHQRHVKSVDNEKKCVNQFKKKK